MRPPPTKYTQMKIHARHLVAQPVRETVSRNALRISERRSQRWYGVQMPTAVMRKPVNNRTQPNRGNCHGLGGGNVANNERPAFYREPANSSVQVNNAGR